MSNLSAGQFSQNVILTKWRHILLLPASDVNKEPFRVNKRGRYLAQLLLSLSLVAGRGVCLEVYHALDRLVISLNAVIIDMNFIHVRWNFFSLILSFSHSFSLSQFLPQKAWLHLMIIKEFVEQKKPDAWNLNIINLRSQTMLYMDMPCILFSLFKIWSDIWKVCTFSATRFIIIFFLKKGQSESCYNSVPQHQKKKIIFL